MQTDNTRASGGLESQVLATVARGLLHRFPLANPAMVVRAVIDARDGLAAFGFRSDERSAALITETAASDPRLRLPYQATAPT